MGRVANNTVPFSDQAIAKKVRAAKGAPRKEWRVQNCPGLVLITQPTGTGTFYLFYRAPATRQLRKLRIGEYGQAHLGKSAASGEEAKRFGLSEAREFAFARLAEINQGADPVGTGIARRTALTFRELAEKFLSENKQLADSTREVYAYSLSKAVYGQIGDMPASEVTPDHVVQICKRIEATGANVQSERTKSIIGGVYRWGMKQRLVSSNPSKEIGRRTQKVARTRTPSNAELKKLWMGLEREDTKLSSAMRHIIQLAMLTGQRRTEICGARVSELHLDGDKPTWVIPGKVNKRGKIIPGRTKNGREQIVQLSRQAAEIFMKALGECSDDEFVFPSERKRLGEGRKARLGHIHGDSVTQAMERLREDCGVEDVSIHDMRRAISNWLKNEGVSREVRDLILNHKDQSVDGEHYSASARMEVQVRNAMQSWADHLDTVVGSGAGSRKVVELRRA